MRERDFIVVYGRDAQLLDTRCWVLEQAGYRVLTVLNLKDAEQATRTEDISVLILCYTLSTSDCHAVIKMAESLAPGMKILSLTAAKPAFSEHTISAFDGPRRLIQAVAKLCSADGSALIESFRVP